MGKEAAESDRQVSGSDCEGARAFTIRVARGRSELASAYRLVYRRYLAKGYVGSRPAGMVYHPRFALCTSRTLVAATEGGQIVGTMSLVGDNPDGLQLEEIYRAEVDSLRAQCRSVAEVTCLCIDTEPQHPGKDIFAGLTKFAIHHAYLKGYDDLLLAIHPRHYRTYWHTFRAYPIGPCREYPSVSDNPALLCRIELHNLEANMTPRMRQFYFEHVEPPSHYDGPPVSWADHEEFCRMLAIRTDISDNVLSVSSRDAA